MTFSIKTSRARHLSEDKPSANLSNPNSELWVLASLLGDSLNLSLQVHFINLLHPFPNNRVLAYSSQAKSPLLKVLYSISNLNPNLELSLRVRLAASVSSPRLEDSLRRQLPKAVYFHNNHSLSAGCLDSQLNPKEVFLINPKYNQLKACLDSRRLNNQLKAFSGKINPNSNSLD